MADGVGPRAAAALTAVKSRPELSAADAAAFALRHFFGGGGNTDGADTAAAPAETKAIPAIDSAVAAPAGGDGERPRVRETAPRSCREV